MNEEWGPGKIFGYFTDLEKFVKGGRQEEMEGTREIEQPASAKGPDVKIG
jgi:hypothetical protein